MKKLYIILAALIVSLFASNALAFTPPPSPAPVSWISDSSHVLSDAAHARLDAKLRQINQGSANEIAALIVPTLDGADIADVGDLTAKAGGVGKKDLDNGVLVVLAMKEHKSRIATGKGVEGDLPDLKANDILQAARPYLRKGDVEGALSFIFDRTSSTIANHKADVAAGRSSSQPSCQASAPGAVSSSGLIMLIAILGMSGLLWYLVRSTKRRHAEEAERERQAREARMRVRQAALAEQEAQRKREAERKAQLAQAAPVAPAPVAKPRTTKKRTTRPVKPKASSSSSTANATAAAAAAAALIASEEAARRLRAEESRRRREREEEDARRARERAEEDRRRRDREEEDERRRRDSYSSSSSSSSFNWGGGSGGSGGFGGGDFGGGGGSSDW